MGSRSVVGEAPGHRAKNFPGNLLHFFSPFLHLPITPGDIEVFKGMPLISLDLFRCYELTGVFGLGQGTVGGVKIGNRLRPQGLIQRMVQELSPISPLPYAPSTSRLPGNIDSLKDCPLTSLNLAWCKKLEGVTFGYCEPSYPPRTITLCKVLRPQGLIQRMVQELSPISPLPYAPSTS